MALRSEHLKRYRAIAGLLLRHGRADMVGAFARADLDLDDDAATATAGDPAQLARDLETMGPSFIKLGQLLSTRSDLLPAPYLEALANLQDQCEPFAFEQARTIVEDELGVRISKAFVEFEETPIGAASLGQVHRARLRNGRRVAVKVQRPDIRSIVVDDLEVLGEIAGLIDKNTEIGRRYAFGDLLENFRQALLRELDYRREAQHLKILGDNLAAYDEIEVPRPVDDYSTSRVLTMDYVSGTKLTELSPLIRHDFDGKALAETLTRAYLDQVMVDGFFHADPHPGNILLTDDYRIGLLDLGMVGHVDEANQEQLIKMLVAIATGNGREAAEVALTMGQRMPDCNDRAVVRAIVGTVNRHHHSERVNMGLLMLNLARAATDNGLRAAPEVTLLGKTLFHLDEIAQLLEPGFDPTPVVREHAQSVLQRHLLKSLSPAHLLGSALEMNQLVTRLPGRINAFLDTIANNQLRINVDAVDEEALMSNLQKIANRIALGIVLAALIVGAAMLMRIESSFTIFGYPGIAMIFFLVAALSGFALVATIVVGDWRDRRRHRMR